MTATETPPDGAAAEPAEPSTDVVDRELVERCLTLRLLGGLAALLCVLALVAPSVQSHYQLFALGPAAFLLLAMGFTPVELPDLGIRDPEKPRYMAALVVYGVAASVAAASSFGTWHATSTRDFGGFERGAGWYTLTFGLLLAVSAAVLAREDLNQPFDGALHVVALACGTIFIAAALSGTYVTGVSRLRTAVLVAGVVVFVVSAFVLKRRAGDNERSRQGPVVAVMAALGGLMVVTPFMSWGAGGFIVNYWPGAQMGGFDGRVTLWAGAAIVVWWIAVYVDGEASRARWHTAMTVTGVLALAGFFAVLNSGRNDVHPARVFALLACVCVLLMITRDGSFTTDTEREEREDGELVQRSFSALVGLFGGLFLIYSFDQYLGFGFRSTANGLLDLATFGGFGLVLVSGAVGAASGRVMSARLASIVLAGFALLAAIADSSKLVVLVMGGLAAVGFFAHEWMGPTRRTGIVSTLGAVDRSKWARILLAGVVSFALWRILEELKLLWMGESSDLPDDERAAYWKLETWLWRLQIVIAVPLAAALTTDRKHLKRAIPVIAAGAAVFIAFQQGVGQVSELLIDSNAWRVISAFGVMTFLAFALGRGKHSMLALLVVSVATHSTLLYALTHMVFNLGIYDLFDQVLPWFPVHLITRDVRRVVWFVALAWYFVAFPIRRAEPAPREVEPQHDAGVQHAGG